ncbi:hypothetical protein [Desulfovibrio inopinatus]|uniref:hypothetical protein n=1 Tax=Desulfovibrio inopinatus TaxID=102109 RepID=UPI0005575949|nr:hypothetical protein [Desulfovibrio inopinatus]
MFGRCKEHQGRRGQNHHHGHMGQKRGRGQGGRRHARRCDSPPPWHRNTFTREQENDVITMAPETEEFGVFEQARCPLCENHCPLDAPACKKGKAYAASALRNQ